MKTRDRISSALHVAAQQLLAERCPEGHWEGTLSSSALSTATATIALTASNPAVHRSLIQGGLHWLASHQNPDGGWGDTVRSQSNISTTALCWAAFGASQTDSQFAPTVERAASWLEEKAGAPGVTPLQNAITARYGKDHTFSVPILLTLALAGRLGSDGWRRVPALPFELATLPRELFGALQLPVVSYALPALIAIGQVLHHHAPSRNPLLRWLRHATRKRTLRVLETLQPPNGGFLEATPLTSFVAMSLASMGLHSHPVLKRALTFLESSVRPDGSWPIDTNLATWVTTLSLKALSRADSQDIPGMLVSARPWLIRQQYRGVHPYTLASPGGWSWTDLPGGVPDADDTAGALLALLSFASAPLPTEVLHAGLNGTRWLLGLQNRDGGIPTFCRGWGALPFDRSSPDLTAHALRAWAAWLLRVGGPARHAIAGGIERALPFLVRSQNPDGSWTPLWFGNESAPSDENRTYGTACVLLALEELRLLGFRLPPQLAERASAWLLSAQDPSGGWGGAPGISPTVEETGLAVEALATCEPAAAEKGGLWLTARIEDGTWMQPAPIGFYFAKLWYFERLYPQIFATAGLSRLLHQTRRDSPNQPTSVPASS
jgi:squalene-hopene/tetraprenyl-beta-curcumene cyclase